VDTRLWRILAHAFAHNPVLMLAAALVVVQVLAAVFAALIAPYDPVAQAVELRLAAPSAEFWLGTDKLGRNVLSRILHGYQSSQGIAFSAVLAVLLFGGTLGIWAGFKGGWVDRVIMRLADVLFAFPIILLAIGVIAILGANATSTVIAIAVVYAPSSPVWCAGRLWCCVLPTMFMRHAALGRATCASWSGISCPTWPV